MSSSLSPALKSTLEVAEDTIPHINTTRYACGITILCYDTLLRFGDEVQLVWGSQWNAPKYLLYFNRNFALFFLLLNTWTLAGYRPSLDNTTCAVITTATAFSAIFSYCIANWMLLLRVSALYGHNRIIFWFLTIFWILSYIATFTAMGITSLSLRGQITYSALLDVCFVPRVPPTLPAVWVCPMAFETTTFLMNLYKIWSHARDNGDLKSNPLLFVLYRDGVQYFVVIMGMRFFNLICWLVFPVSLMFLGVFIYWSLIIVMVERLFLNLRGLYKVEERTVDCERRNNPNTEAENNLRRPTPVVNRVGTQSANVFSSGIMIHDVDFSIISPTRSIGVIDIHASRTEEEWNRSPYN